tara:strand:+ start:5628 stop:6440 length:813 start_codon:yes stop_codon:yes gene_type:complete
MADYRIPKLGVAVGKKGIGKTYTTTQMIDSYVKGSKGVQPRRALILDVNDEFDQYKAISLKHIELFSVHPKIEVRRVRPFGDDGRRMTLKDISAALWQILEVYRGGLLLIEDVSKYISDNLPNDLIGALCTNRHTNTDIVMHFQSIGRITPKIWQNINWLRFHKNSDTTERHKNKFPDKLVMLGIVESIVNKKYYEGDKRHFIWIDIDEEKIFGKFNTSDIEEAIDEYCSMNYRTIIKPFINKRDSKGKKIYTDESALSKAKKQLRQTYF